VIDFGSEDICQGCKQPEKHIAILVEILVTLRRGCNARERMVISSLALCLRDGQQQRRHWRHGRHWRNGRRWRRHWRRWWRRRRPGRRALFSADRHGGGATAAGRRRRRRRQQLRHHHGRRPHQAILLWPYPHHLLQASGTMRFLSLTNWGRCVCVFVCLCVCVRPCVCLCVPAPLSPFVRRGLVSVFARSVH